MTQPTEADIRAACEEAGLDEVAVEFTMMHPRHTFSRAIHALARRIAAERGAVPVAIGTMCARCHTVAPEAFSAQCFLPECPYSTHPPKEPQA